MNQSTTTETARDGVHHSKPIPISTEHFRHRSASFSSDISNSPNSSPPLATPKNFPPSLSSSSPILYYLSQSPSKSPATFPFRGFAPPPVLEDEPIEEYKPPTHIRRSSTAGRFQPQPPASEPHYERGVNVLRRLSLSGPRPRPPVSDTQTGIPSPPPNSAVSGPPARNEFLSTRKPKRSATVTDHTRARRAPSPMGERILKGHFDGFN